MKNSYFRLSMLLPALVLASCAAKLPYNQQAIYKDKFDDAVPVLNVATFHMGETTDANSTEFDENDKKNQQDVKRVAILLAEFKPTIIVIESLPERDSIRRADYLDYLQHPDKKFKDPDERELLAYEIGRLSGAQKLYGIDFKEGYDYDIGEQVISKVDKTTTTKYWQLIDENEKKNPEKGIPFYDLFRLNNHPQYLESLININADLLTYISSKGKSEGANEAAKFYHRNLVMFSNLNQIQVNKNDRILILMGGTHTAFFNDFLKRSPKYKPENIFKYLK
ncbi:DUF5694 domain-containing protein [Flavobacterium sp. DG1-102-2]|uniref:DUF5694 domain-containing protein n=1 Tax=Flavobacterium sp. DG1-102-2 TaxID=3081663 RepID=UPI002949E4D7|nr:DUF5694 domain-containing protein [Flavobacterium sp. DG1-102-2]MDV6168990.1 DUF5694 domain-containing protein [Flavobacterium sp. DG1-102-2]